MVQHLMLESEALQTSRSLRLKKSLKIFALEQSNKSSVHCVIVISDRSDRACHFSAYVFL